MRDAVFIDSGAFVAFLDRSDALHGEVAALFAARPRRWLTSVPVLAETQGFFLHRLGEPAAWRFLDLLPAMHGLELLGMDDGLHRETVDKLVQHRGRKLTYVDASSLVLLGRQGIGRVWGSDFDLAIDGASVVPGPPHR